MKYTKMICRLCLTNLNKETVVSLVNSSEYNEESKLTKMITKYFQLEITLHDTISTSICNACWLHLDDFDKFCKYVEQKQLNLCNEFFEIKCASEGVDALAEEAIAANNDESLLDIKDVFVECDRQLYETSITEFGYAKDEKEILDTGAKNDISAGKTFEAKYTKIERQAKKRPACESTTNSSKKIKKMECNNVKKATRKIKSHKSARLKSIMSQDSTDKDAENEEIDSKIPANTKAYSSNTKPKRKFIQTEEWEESEKLISNNMRLKCELCDAAMETFTQLQMHFRNLHNCKGYVQCCGKRIDQRRKLVDHIQIHLNPNCYQCKICHKTLKRKVYLDMHMESAHSNYEDLKCECPVCGKKFAFQHTLKIHSLVHQTEKTFACKHCDKSFVSNHRLNLHLKRIHDNIPHVCDICGSKFRYKPPFDRHMKLHNGVEAKLEQCNICGEWFKLLERHKKIHYETEIKCNICDRICPNSRALRSHIQYTHKTEKKLKCMFCEKLFKTKNNLEEHIATHTGEKNHRCPHCSKEFRSSANMYVHIKKCHFEEWKTARTVKPTTLAT